jgi:electron transfer flavoprotein alpha subunit
MSAHDVIVLAEVFRGAVADITKEVLGAARGLAGGAGGQVVALVLGDAGAQHVPALSAADRILLVDDPLLAAYSPQPYLTVLQEVVAREKPRAVLVGGTSIGWDVAPALAAAAKLPIVLNCTAARVEGGALKVTASICGGKMLADVTVPGAPAVLMVLPGAFRPAAEAGKAQVEKFSPSAPLQAGAIAFDELLLPEAGDVDITQQDVLVGVGRGIQQKDNVELAEGLSRALGGAVCASRPVVDQGWLPATRQVGKSGMTVKPKLYLALGISGAPEHQEGMKGSGLIVAVNTDPKAPIFDVAHYGAEVDVLDLLPALAEAIQAKKGG